MPVRVRASGLEAALRKYRSEQAYIKAVPAFSVFGNKVLRGIVSSKPTTLKQLEGVKGIGMKRMELYGKDIVRMVNMMNMARRAPARPAKIPAAKIPAARTPAKKVSRFFKAPGSPRVDPLSSPPASPPASPPVSPKGQQTPPQPRHAPCLRLSPPRPRRAPPSVYILELEQGRVYVGSSTDVKRRVEQHVAGTGSAYTRVYRPTGVLLPRLGNVGGDGDAAERDETLRYMMLRGVPYVRGWKFVQVVMPPSEFEEAEANIRELFNLCRRCGYQGHFVAQCRASFDRCGVDLRK